MPSECFVKSVAFTFNFQSYWDYLTVAKNDRRRDDLLEAGKVEEKFTCSLWPLRVEERRSSWENDWVLESGERIKLGLLGLVKWKNAL